MQDPNNFSACKSNSEASLFRYSIIVVKKSLLSHDVCILHFNLLSTHSKAHKLRMLMCHWCLSFKGCYNIARVANAAVQRAFKRRDIKWLYTKPLSPALPPTYWNVKKIFLILNFQRWDGISIRFRFFSRATWNNEINLNRERLKNPSNDNGSLMGYLPPIAAPKTHQEQVYTDFFCQEWQHLPESSVFKLPFIVKCNLYHIPVNSLPKKCFCLKFAHPPSGAKKSLASCGFMLSPKSLQDVLKMR